MLTYDNLEKIHIKRPVERVPFVSDLTIGKTVLDIGCYDETAQAKVNTRYWLHSEITRKARQVIGIDNSDLLPPEGIKDGENSYIHKLDATKIPDSIKSANIDIVVAGEFIEHIENHLTFLKYIRENFPDSTLAITTPNGMSFGNFLMALIRREVQHPDHFHLFSYKTLNTIFTRSGFTNFEIIPYHFYATEMILNSKGLKKIFVMCIEKFIKIFEYFSPLNCMGYIVLVKK